MSARDELTMLVLGKTGPRAADAILAAGYRKPRTITTADELDALGNGALIRTRHGEYREAAKLVGGENIWRAMGPAKVLSSSDLATWSLPASVLHEPEAKP
jgi:hypothetical protein